MEEVIKSVIEVYSGTSPLVVKLLTTIGIARLFIKPCMGLLEAYVKATDDPLDDKLPEKIKSHKIYKLLVYSLDWLVSVKVKKK